MEILEKMLYGLLIGLSQILPVSSLAHSRIYGILSGMEEEPLWSLLAHIGILAALLVHYSKRLRHMQREMQIAGAKKHRRLRQPDMAAVSDYRVILTACIPMIAALVFGPIVTPYVDSLWAMALLLIVNGAMLYASQFLPDGNRQSLAMSPADGFLFGLSSIAAFVPGLSRIGCKLFWGQRRGVDRAYMTDLVLLMTIPWVIGLLVLDIIALFGGGITLSLVALVSALLCGGAAFGGAYGAAAFMQYLAVRIGFHAFAYYSWGAGFVCFILYLMI